MNTVLFVAGKAPIRWDNQIVGHHTIAVLQTPMHPHPYYAGIVQEWDNRVPATNVPCQYFKTVEEAIDAADCLLKILAK